MNFKASKYGFRLFTILLICLTVSSRAYASIGDRLPEFKDCVAVRPYFLERWTQLRNIDLHRDQLRERSKCSS